MRSELEREYVAYVSGRIPRLHRTAYLLCGDPYEADDIVQATLLALYQHWPKAMRADNVDAYVQRIMVRRFIDERRRRWYQRVQVRAALPETPAPGHDDLGERDELVTALRTLPPRQRAAVVLRYLDDLTIEATAEALGCSPGNVKSQCSRGLATLRSLLNESNSSDGNHSARNPERTRS